MVDTIKPIETVYNGYRFRSRLEARWAVFFDALGIRYEYEPEGFEVTRDAFDGVNNSIETVRYLPDFYLPDFETYAEVKPNYEKLMEEQMKLGWCIDFNATPISKGLLILGQIPYWEKQKLIIPHFLQFYWDKGVSARFVYFDWEDCYAIPNSVWEKKPRLVVDEYPVCFGSVTDTIPRIEDSFALNERATKSFKENLYELDFIPCVQVNGHWFDMIPEERDQLSKHLLYGFTKARQVRFEHGEKGGSP